MATHEIEVILSRQWADYLSIPVFLTDPDGNLIFYNEQAEEILGKHFEDTGPMPVEEWSTIFTPQDQSGKPLEPENLPLVKTLKTQRPAQGKFWIKNLKGEKLHLSVTSFPVIGMSAGYLGAIAIFWTKEME